LLITDDGYVRNVTEHLRAASRTMTFSIKLEKNSGPPRPQLVFAIALSKPLEALKLPPDGLRTEQVFPQMLTEASQRGLTLNVTAKYFLLQNASEGILETTEPLRRARSKSSEGYAVHWVRQARRG
jgi:hypothetical protein